MEARTDDTLVEVGQVVRQLLAAHTRDTHLVEDLTQETLVRVAAAEARGTPDSLQAYAFTTARNLLVAHARGEAIQGRHAHRLVDYASLDGPEHLTLQREETDALAIALEQLEEADRELLLRHEVDDIDLATLAQETSTSKGAVAMRLARARATLRLEFLLAFRNVKLPTAQCRPVLLALSTRDRRRQRTLDSTGHLNSCPTCASLDRPITEQDRRIAGWIPVPIAAAMKRVWRVIREHPVVSSAGTVAAAALVVALIVAADSDEAPSARQQPSTTTPSMAPTTTAPTATAPVTLPPPSTSGPPPCPPVAPLDSLNPATVAGCPFAPTIVTATDVPAEEGFLATTSGGQPVWIHLVGSGESPLDVQPGMTLTISGLTAPADSTPVAGTYAVDVAYGDLRPAG